MINHRIVLRALGSLLYIESLLLALSMLVGAVYQETDFLAFGIPTLVSACLGFGLTRLGRNAENRLSRRDGYLVVSLTWIVFSVVGMLPFLLSGVTSRPAVAFFEAMSGFTTTGSTAFANVDALPHSVLFWRSISHWLGGMGIVFFTLAILPGMSNGDQKLFAAEATGLKLGKLHPRIGTTARWLWGFYMMLTGLCIGAFYLAGMGVFDAVNHALSAVATGGFSTHTASIGWFHSPLIELTTALFMFFASINFALLYLILFRGKLRIFWKDSELRGFILLLVLAIITMTVIITPSNWLTCADGPVATLLDSLRRAVFNCVSVMSTTGFTTEDYMLWHPNGWIIISLIGICGACAGSTSGGVKVIRVITAAKALFTEFIRALHPRAVIPVRINGNIVPGHVIRTVFAFFTAYVVILVIAVMITCGYGYGLTDSFGMTISSLSNIGPTIGRELGPLDAWGILPDGLLWLNSFLMLCGRLEIFSLLLPFIPAFWQEN